MSASSQYRCPTCNSASVNPRNLVVFIDGTSNKPGDKNTNVVKLYCQVKVVDSSAHDAEPEQRKMYWTGIGTHPEHLPPFNRVWREIYSWFEMAFAWNVEKNVKHAYAWLAEHYKEGSQIYLFGFSRGAYQVRVLASMIHEVGLTWDKEHVDMAYDHYLSIHPYKPQTRVEAHKFKRNFCRPGVRVHFVGAWDTVSSIGLIKKDVFVSASANVINSCHFRHALALDERRVKFMPEYFGEMNVHRGNIRTPTPPVGDVKEVWFAGSHSDVGGTNRPDPERVLHPEEGDHISHAGYVPLQWMRREATDQGLVFNPEMLLWDAQDVDFGRKDTMTVPWRSLEVLPIRHQVSFSGPGKHERRFHWFQPRQVIPAQQIHASVLSGDIYAPRATFGAGIGIPTASRRTSDALWTTELVDQRAMTEYLTSVFNDQRKTLESLEKVIFLLDSWLDNGRTPVIPWPERSIRGSVSLSIIYSSLSASEELVSDARNSLKGILARRERQECREALFVLRFLARHETLRRRIVSPDVVTAVVGALGWTTHKPSEILFPLVIDSLCYLIQDDSLRDKVTGELNETESGKTRLILALEVNAPDHLVALLKLIASLAKYQSSGQSTGPCEVLKPRIIELAEKSRGSVGVAAVEALVALNVPPRNLHFSTTLGYLGNTLPLSEVEGGSSSSPDDIVDLPVILRVDGSNGLDEKLMHTLVSTVKSHDTRTRTDATLSLLKLCKNPEIRKYLSDHNFVDVLMKQLEQKETSLLASYALETCLRHGMHVDLPRAAQVIFIVFSKGWFDDSVGRVEGFTIFRKLMMSGNLGELRQEVVKLGIVDVAGRKFEASDPHEVRVGLLCLDILNKEHPEFLTSLVDQSLTRLRSKHENIWKKGVKVLSALARTVAGEEAIKPRMTEIVKMLLERPRSHLPGPAAALYALSRNETLREQIKGSEEFVAFKRQRRVTLNSRGL